MLSTHKPREERHAYGRQGMAADVVCLIILVGSAGALDLSIARRLARVRFDLWTLILLLTVVFENLAAAMMGLTFLRGLSRTSGGRRPAEKSGQGGDAEVRG